MLDDIYFMKQALIEAGKAAERGEVPVGAVVVCKERIIARAHNLTETLNDVTAYLARERENHGFILMLLQLLPMCLVAST